MTESSMSSQTMRTFCNWRSEWSLTISIHERIFTNCDDKIKTTLNVQALGVVYDWRIIREFKLFTRSEKTVLATSTFVELKKKLQINVISELAMKNFEITIFSCMHEYIIYQLFRLVWKLLFTVVRFDFYVWGIKLL